MRESSESMPSEILAYFGELSQEERRLFTPVTGVLEFARSQELIRRHLPPPDKVVLDVGGGPGAYSCWLAREGYEVHLIDPVPRHLEQAKLASDNQPDHPVATVTQVNALSLAQHDEVSDAVLLMGPLYHLTRRDDRIKALREARRVLRTGGLVFAAVINRFASLLDGLKRGLIDDPDFVEILQRDMAEGQHRSPQHAEVYFTTAYFHRPDELEAEIREAGLTLKELVAVQGPGWLAEDFSSRWSDPGRRTQLLELVRAVEHEETLFGMSNHLMVIAEK